MGYIKGHYRKSIWESDNGYIIGIFKVIDTDIEDMEIYLNRTITFTGYFHELNDIDTYMFYGNLTNHPKYGEQFSVENYERLKPEEKDSMVEFLSSGLFKGIGEAKAKKIVSVLGKDTFNVILNNPSNLILIPTVTEKNANTLHDKLVEYESSYETILYLSKLGFNTKDSMLIYNKYKENTTKIIDEDIYRLIEDINEINFKKIDNIAINAGIEKNSINRISASILYILRELTIVYGNSYYSKEEIVKNLYKVLGVEITEEEFLKAIDNLTINLKLIIKDNKYYLLDMYEAENNICERVMYLTRKEVKSNENIDEVINEIENDYNIKYNNEQMAAIKSSYLNNILIITGGPGTGKTTIIKGILELFRKINGYSHKDMLDSVALLAPTGRASKRMSEQTSYPASTIHRFLKWNKETDTFQINEYNKSKVEFVILDEASMIDTYLFDNLLKGLSVNTKIIIVGDYDQLPSVGPGEVLYDLINSNMINTIYLKELYRQEEGSNIITLSNDIKNDNLNMNIFNNEDDLTFIECTNLEVVDTISNLADTYKDLSYKEFQILAPMYKTICGIDNINSVIQSIYNKKSSKKKEINVGEVTYREGDKVIQLTNMPDDNVYNGDIGIIEKIDTKKKEIYIDFDNNLVKYTPSNFSNFKLAYAISIHKSQGSEFDIVVIPIVSNFKTMLYKKLIYTGITRSKKKLYLIGEVNALRYAVNNKNTELRRTSIIDLLNMYK